MHFIVNITLIVINIVMALGETTVKPFDYNGARTYLDTTNPDLAEIAGQRGGFWGCWLNNWTGGCHWWPPLDGCQDVAFENVDHNAVDTLASFGPDEGSACQVFEEKSCADHSMFWPGNKHPGAANVFYYPGFADSLRSAASFHCWKV